MSESQFKYRSFSLKALMLLVLVVALCFGAYNFGLQNGRQEIQVEYKRLQIEREKSQKKYMEWAREADKTRELRFKLDERIEHIEERIEYTHD